MQQQSHAQLTHLAGGYAMWQPAGTPHGSVAQLVAIPANWKLTSCPNASTAAHEHQPVHQQHVLLTMGTAPANAASSCWPASKQAGRLMQHLSNTVAAAGAGRPYPGSSYRYLDRSGSPGSLSNASSPPGSQHLPCLSAASQQLARQRSLSATLTPRNSVSIYSTLAPVGPAYPAPSGTSEILGFVSHSVGANGHGHHASGGSPLHASYAPHAGHLHVQLAQQHGSAGYAYAGVADVNTAAPDEKRLSRCTVRDGAPASHHGHGIDMSAAVAYAAAAAAAAAGHPGPADYAAHGKPAKRARTMLTPVHHDDHGMPASGGCEPADVPIDPRSATHLPHHAHSHHGLGYADCKLEQYEVYEVHELGVRYSSDHHHGQGSGAPGPRSSDSKTAAAATSDTAHNLLTLAALAESCSGAGAGDPPVADPTHPKANAVTGREVRPSGSSGRLSRRQASPTPQHGPCKAGAISGRSAFQATAGRSNGAFKALGPAAPAATTFSGHSEDDSEPPSTAAKAQARHAGTGTGARNRTKNQEAQARFRARRKAMLADLKRNVVDLQSRMEDSIARARELEMENIALKAKLEALQSTCKRAQAASHVVP